MCVGPNAAQTHRKLNAILRGKLVGRILSSNLRKQTTERANQ